MVEGGSHSILLVVFSTERKQSSEADERALPQDQGQPDMPMSRLPMAAGLKHNT